jgi:hypothetical protein
MTTNIKKKITGQIKKDLIDIKPNLDSDTDNDVGSEESDTINGSSDSKVKVKKTADRKKYMREWLKNNKHRWSKENICSECDGKYTSNNYTNHMRSKKHEYALIKKENMKLQQIKTIMVL